MKPQVKAFYDGVTSTLTYVVWDSSSQDALIIDPLLNYDQAASEYFTESVNKVVEFVSSKKLQICGILETHVHADHLTGSQFLKKHYPKAPVGISSRIVVVQDHFSKVFNYPQFNCDGSQFDLLFTEESVTFGSLKVQPLATPGHTPADLCYLIGDALFTGDSIFMPDMGTGRCDFPAGSAIEMYHSIKNKIYTLPQDTRIFVGHDYQPGGRELKYQTTVLEQKKNNIHIKEDTAKEEFVNFRTQRDMQLGAPQLILPSLQFNMNAGRFYQVEQGTNYFKIPVSPKS